jgi:hypothetical protein
MGISHGLFPSHFTPSYGSLVPLGKYMGFPFLQPAYYTLVLVLQRTTVFPDIPAHACRAPTSVFLTYGGVILTSPYI